MLWTSLSPPWHDNIRVIRNKLRRTQAKEGLNIIRSCKPCSEDVKEVGNTYFINNYNYKVWKYKLLLNIYITFRKGPTNIYSVINLKFFMINLLIHNLLVFVSFIMNIILPCNVENWIKYHLNLKITLYNAVCYTEKIILQQVKISWIWENASYFFLLYCYKSNIMFYAFFYIFQAVLILLADHLASLLRSFFLCTVKYTPGLKLI